MVNITIDGKSLQVPDGTTLLQAAQSAGIQIPTLCDHPELVPYGGCRLCVVEIDGFRTLQTSCTMPASNNMVVHTDTEKVREARNFILTMLFSERNHFCPYCQVSGGDCELQNAAYAQGMTHWDLQPNWQPYEVDASNKYFVLDNNRCILCRRCVRACGELVGNFTLGFEERGAKSFLVADLGTPLGESSCISCGTCVQVCPTGALIDRQSAYRGKETQVEHNPTICAGCSVGCKLDVLVRDNHLVRIEGIWDSAVGEGVICKVGRFEPIHDDRERIGTPLIRKDGKLKAATWDEALEKVANQFRPLIGKKKDGIAALASTRLSAETLFLFREIFAGHFQSDMVTTLEEGAATAQAAIFAEETGKPFEGDLKVIDESDCIVVLDTDLVNDHEVIGFYVKRAVGRGARLVIIDPTVNSLENFAHSHLKATKGSHADVLEALTAAIVKLGLAKSAGSIKADTIISSSQENTGIASDKIVEAGRLIGAASKPVFIYGGNFLGQKNTDNLKALMNLSKTLGIEKSIIGAKGKANSLAASQYRLDKPIEINGNQAVYIVVGDENISQKLLQRLQKPSFLVVQASYASQLTAMADVVLPVENWTEQEGHFLNFEGKIQKGKAAIKAPEGVWANDSVLKTMAGHLGINIKVDGWKEALQKRPSSAPIVES